MELRKKHEKGTKNGLFTNPYRKREWKFHKYEKNSF
ncbi:hypothetical protein BCE_1973 [Bacillus cereus ATCC 10987]|uniref:Uncharacterized protein n=1 Tax=Bacillus cereus (strain ATCC 10987 / NRS 248) TaxID=222523 RepID=Q73A13_BACC1|nr:hypothetical protein BCE_1973 [Bacillus cereus ATCC 10987]